MNEARLVTLILAASLSLGTVTNAQIPPAAVINNRGQVGGLSLLIPDNPANATFHSFFWENGVTTDLGVLPGAACPTCPLSTPYVLTFIGDINNKGRVAGHTCDASIAARSSSKTE